MQPMALLEIDKRRIVKILESYCASRIPAHIRDQVRLGYEFHGNKVHLVESRPVFQRPDHWVDMKVAQFEFTPATRKWKLYCFDRNSKRIPYSHCQDEERFETLLAEVDKDPTGIFWG